MLTSHFLDSSIVPVCYSSCLGTFGKFIGPVMKRNRKGQNIRPHYLVIHYFETPRHAARLLSSYCRVSRTPTPNWIV